MAADAGSAMPHAAGPGPAAGVPCALMRGGTSKGLFFEAEDLPAAAEERDELLLRLMGTPDPRQIDGLGGAHPLTSKVAIVSPSSQDGVDVDYLFLQLGVEEATVASAQTCGNLLAAVGPFALLRGLVEAGGETTSVRIRLVNTGDLATATFPTPDGVFNPDGPVGIDGVPGTGAGIDLLTTAGPDAALLPTGHVTDVVAGHRATLINNGMAVVMLRAAEFGLTGVETPEELEANAPLRTELETVRLQAGRLMGLGDVRKQSVPKLFLISPPRHGGDVSTRAFIPHRVHPSIGVLMAASVAAGLRIPGTVGSEDMPPGAPKPATGVGQHETPATLLEHPGGTYPARVAVARTPDGTWRASSAATRTARLLMDGRAYPRPRL